MFRVLHNLAVFMDHFPYILAAGHVAYVVCYPYARRQITPPDKRQQLPSIIHAKCVKPH